MAPLPDPRAPLACDRARPVPPAGSAGAHPDALEPKVPEARTRPLACPWWAAASHRPRPRGTWAFCSWRRHGWASYPPGGAAGPPSGVGGAAAGGRGDAYGGVRLSSLTWLCETYRWRFGIESSERPLQPARSRTPTGEPLLRLLYVGGVAAAEPVGGLHGEGRARWRRNRQRVDLSPLSLRALRGRRQRCREEPLGYTDCRTMQCPMKT